MPIRSAVGGGAAPLAHLRTSVRLRIPGLNDRQDRNRRPQESPGHRLAAVTPTERRSEPVDFARHPFVPRSSDLPPVIPPGGCASAPGFSETSRGRPGPTVDSPSASPGEPFHRESRINPEALNTYTAPDLGHVRISANPAEFKIRARVASRARRDITRWNLKFTPARRPNFNERGNDL